MCGYLSTLGTGRSVYQEKGTYDAMFVAVPVGR